MDFKKIADAFEFAMKAHYGVNRKQSFMPYIVHPVEAAFIVQSVAGDNADEDLLIAAILHDVVEDTDYTQEDIKQIFGQKIAELVAYESEDKMKSLPKDVSWKLRKEASIKHLSHAPYEAKLICLADKLSNIKQTVVDKALRGDTIWEKFNQKDASLQEWYYKSIINELSEFKDTKAYQELKACFDFVFDKKD